MIKIFTVFFLAYSGTYMEMLEKNIAEILYQLEKIFSLDFFDSIKHLLVHLAYEAKIEGSVQFHWMYLFERQSW